MKKIIKKILKPVYIQYSLLRKKFLIKHFPRYYIIKEYRKRLGKTPDLENPKDFSEKIQWLKLNYRDDLIVTCSDKFAVREYVKQKLGADLCVPLIGVYDKPEEIDFNILPQSFVLKPNNSSGRVLICKDKAHLSIKKAKKTLNKWQKENLSSLTGEWVYEKSPFKIIAEQFLQENITDYKLYFAKDTFIATQVISDRLNNFYIDYFDEKWCDLGILRNKNKNNPMPTEKPKAYEKMIEVGKILCAPFPFSRLDFYEVSEKIYVGEISFFPNNGFVSFKTSEMDKIISEKIDIQSLKEKAKE